ncbi:hypothetical protein ACQ4M4_18065 [Leptolyngbya sp. AN02str]|uniref:hypothetical protein n=1 Tax=Leptolyngbya sp. AN02str TaxID=3423363 RepID=UPI003D316529
MTAFSTGDVPATINTFEKLCVWALSIENDLNGTLTYEPEAGTTDFVAQALPLQIYRGPNIGWRFEGRISIPMGSGDWRRGPGKIWTYAQELSTTALPSAYRS